MSRIEVSRKIAILVALSAICMMIAYMVYLTNPNRRLERYLGSDCIATEIRRANCESRNGIWRVAFLDAITDSQVLETFGMNDFEMVSSNIQPDLTREVVEFWNDEGPFTLYLGCTGDPRWVLLRGNVAYIGEIRLD